MHNGSPPSAVALPAFPITAELVPLRLESALLSSSHHDFKTPRLVSFLAVIPQRSIPEEDPVLNCPSNLSSQEDWMSPKLTFKVCRPQAKHRCFVRAKMAVYMLVMR